MKDQEATIWEKLNHARVAPLSASWLMNIYSLNLSTSLRMAIADHLGWMGDKGWSHLKLIIQREGIQPELILAAGLSHQHEAKNWLIKLLYESQEMRIEIIQALACWGAEIPVTLLNTILNEKSKAFRLAGLELLSFKAHLLSDEVLLEILNEPLKDFRNEVVLKAIQILQRRNSAIISSKIAVLARKGPEVVSKSALLALGCIGTIHSQNELIALRQELPIGPLKAMSHKQLKQQYRFLVLTEEVKKTTENFNHLTK